MSLGLCGGQQAPGGWSQVAEPGEAPAHGRTPLQEAILISLAALQPGLTQAGARPS